MLRLAVVAMAVMAAAASDSGPGKQKERRMTAEERAAVFERLEKDHEDTPVCIPPETPPTSKCPLK